MVAPYPDVLQDACSSCQAPAMPNGRCRLHGGKSTGAPKGNRNALKHGRYSAEAVALRRALVELMREAREGVAFVATHKSR
jgi:uncharacterized protein YjcR